MSRLTRTEQTAQSRQRVLEAAGRLFRSKGFHNASLDEIADQAGFSKGVIYSQFGSKDDLFLALLERRAEWRIGDLRRRLQAAPQGASLREFWEHGQAVRQSDSEWMLLLIEFRVHAARHPEINQRYIRLHEKALAHLAEVFEELAAKANVQLRHPPADIARLASCLDVGGALEEQAGGLGAAFELSRHAMWLLLKESTPIDHPKEEDSL